MQGTCIETAPQKMEGEDEPYVFCFFTDISANPEIIDYVQTIQTDIKNTLTNMTRYLNRWKKYRSIWKVDKVWTTIFALLIQVFNWTKIKIRWYMKNQNNWVELTQGGGKVQ